MRFIISLILLCLNLVMLQAQQDSAVYSAGDLPTEYQAFISLSDESFACTDTLRVNITPGHYVTSVDVYYQIEALPGGNGWVSDQGSYLEITNTSLKEPAVSFGDPDWDSAGVFSYTRTGLSFANGVYPSGELDFFLHAFRGFGQFPVCNAAVQRVVNGSWKIVVHHIPAPTCLPPTGLSFTAVGVDDVDLLWNTGGAASWQLEYGPPGFSPGSGTLVPALTNPFNLAGLMPNTSYDIYVRDSCAPGDVSIWDGPLNITTLCSFETAPWTENFDGSNWVAGFGLTNAGDQISACWNRPPTGNPNFSVGTGPTTSAGTGPLADFSGTGNYLYTEASGAAGTGEITTPRVYIPPTLSQPALEFYYHLYGASIDSLNVEVDNGTGFTSVLSLVGEQQSANADAWRLASVSLSSYAGDTLSIRFNGTNSGFTGDIAIDEVSVRTVTCLPPSALVVSNPTTGSLDLSWTTGGATNWQVGYRILNSGNPYTIVAATSNPFTITGLQPGTNYELMVRDSCAPGDVSAWFGPAVGQTLCSFETAPWIENFDGNDWFSGTGGGNGGNIIGPCWDRPNSNNPNFSTRNGPTASTGTGPLADFSGVGNYLYTEASGAPGSGELSTPEIFIPLTMLNPALFFRSHLYGGDIDSLTVAVSSNGGTFTQIFSLVGEQQSASSDPWQLQKVDLSTYAGDTVQLRFTGTNSGFEGDIAIDEVGIQPVTCPEPTNLNLVSRTTTSITLSWTTGGAANWLVGYRLAGSGGALNILSATTNPVTITGLTPDTEYEIFVKDSCAVGDVSIWQGPLIAATRCLPFTAPWLEDFEGAEWVPGIANGLNEGNEISSCWSRPSAFGPNFGAWSGPTQSAGTGPASGNGGSGGYIYTEVSGGANGAGLITSPDIIVPSSFANPRLSFYYHMFGSDIDSLVVQLDSGAGFNNNILVLSGQQQTSENDPWIYFSYDLTTYLGDTIAIRFRGVTNSGFAGDVAIDDVEVDDAPACPRPTNLNIISVTGNDITLGWTTGGAANWQIEYGPPGFAPGTGTRINANTNPFTITGLNANTPYDIYLRDSCGVGLVSLWSDVISARTLCGVFQLPFSENFDGAEWQAGGGPVNTGYQISPCWSNPGGANPDFGVGTGATPSAGTGPSADVSGSGNFLYTEASGGASGTGRIRTPQIVFDGTLNTVNLSFAYHLVGANIDSFYVSVDDGSGFSQVFSLVGTQQASVSDPWITTTVNLDTYIGDTVIIEFAGVNSGFAGDIAIDEVSIDTNSCPVPANLQVTSQTDNSVTLSWTTGGASSWQIEYGPPGFTPGSGTLVAVNSNPFTVTGLSPATDYCFFLRDSCGPGSLSEWINLCAATDCAPLIAPWSENFDGPNWATGLGAANTGNQIDPCWSRPSEQNPNFSTWTGPTASGNTGPASDLSGSGKYIYTEASGSQGTGAITSPSIAIPSSMSSPRLIFWYHMYGAGIDSLNVEVDNGSGFTNIFGLAGPQQTSNNDGWLRASIDLSSYSGDTLVIRFRGTNSNFQGDIAIDEVSVDDINCPAPTNLQTTASTGTSITVSWNTGGAANWQVAYRPLGATTPYTIIAAAANPFVINGLNPGTSYEIMVRDSCGINDVSDWVGPVTGSTTCQAVGAPWSEDFDTGSWSEGTGATNIGDEIEPCWIRASNTGLRWGTGSGATPSFNTGPQNDFIASGKYLYIEASNGAGTASIESPEIFIPNVILNPRLKFAYHFYGAGITSFTIEIDDGSGYQNLTTINGQQQTSSQAPWLMDSVSLTAYIDDTVRFRFNGTVSNFQGDMAIDQLSLVGNLLPCLPPSQMSFTNVNTTSADINWPGSSGNAEVEVVTAGQPQGTGTLYPGASSPLSVTGLTPGTAYDVYIREICGSINSSWIDSSFTTLTCPLVQASFTNQNNLLQVNFDGSATAGADSIAWLFGDGNSGSGQTISHTYAAPGNYPVSLIAWNTCGNYDTLLQNIQVCDSLLADFSFTTSGDSVFLDATASVGASQFFWDLGDGTDTSGILISHGYGSPGTKVVQMIAVNLCGDSVIVTKNVRICLPPVADWTYNIISTNVNGMQVQFDATASQNASAYAWDFGDGNTLTGQVVPIHTYVTPGLFYRVTLRVTNDCGEENARSYRLSEIGLTAQEFGADIQVFPNPAVDEFVLKWDPLKSELHHLTMVDFSGKVILQIDLANNTDGKLRVSVGDWPSGAYLLRIKTKAREAHYPLMIR